MKPLAGYFPKRRRYQVMLGVAAGGLIAETVIVLIVGWERSNGSGLFTAMAMLIGFALIELGARLFQFRKASQNHADTDGDGNA